MSAYAEVFFEYDQATIRGGTRMRLKWMCLAEIAASQPQVLQNFHEGVFERCWVALLDAVDRSSPQLP